MGTEKRRRGDMTQGDALRSILAFAAPVFLGNLFQQAYSMADTMVAGYRLGDYAIAAIGATSSLYLLLISLSAGVNNGYSIVITQCFGARGEAKLRAAIAGTMLLNGAAALALTSAALFFLKPLLYFMRIPDVIFADAYRYIAVICAGLAATVLYNMFAGILRAFGNSRVALYVLILSSVCNIILDLFFVVILDMGIVGAAFATVIAQALSAIGCALYLYRAYRFLLPGFSDFRVGKGMLAELLSQGFSLGLAFCVVDLGSVIFQRANNSLGEAVISAHTAARRIIEMMMEPMGTIEMAAVVFVGQNWGAGKVARIKDALRRMVGMELVWAFVSCALIFPFGGTLVRLLTGTADEGIVGNAVMSLRWHIGFFPVLGSFLVLRASLQAMGKKVVPVIASCLELSVKLASALFLIPKIGFLGSSVTEPIAWTLMLLFLLPSIFLQASTVSGKKGD